MDFEKRLEAEMRKHIPHTDTPDGTHWSDEAETAHHFAHWAIEQVVEWLRSDEALCAVVDDAGYDDSISHARDVFLREIERRFLTKDSQK